MPWLDIATNPYPLETEILFRGKVKELNLITHWVKKITLQEKSNLLITCDDVQFFNGVMHKCLATHWMLIPEINESEHEDK